MIKIEINKETCTGDAKCVEVCPRGILRMNEKKYIPEFIPGGDEICINCGQCFAVCPHGAINLSTMAVKDAMQLEYSKLPNAEQVELFLKGRRSIRSYQNKPVTKESIEKLLDIVRYAPSGLNQQPVNWLVISGKDTMHELVNLVSKWMEDLVQAESSMASAFHFDRVVESWRNGEDKICRGAPCVVFAYGAKDNPMAPQACTIAATYLELAAFGFGFGACWGGYVYMAINSSEEIKKFVGLSADEVVGSAMMLGYSRHQYSRIPMRNPAKLIWK